jgi:kynureninase
MTPSQPAQTLDRAQCLDADERDPLKVLIEAFDLPPGVIYLDGNSLGALPKHVPARLERAVREEWGRGLIRSWNDAGWIDAPRRAGARIARLIGARPDEVIVADSTSINLYKLLAAALALRPDRRVVLTERGNFPTDLYIAQGLLDQMARGHRLRRAERSEILEALDDSVAVLMLTQVDYRSGERFDLAEITAAAHRVGALVIWDLAHSAGAFQVDLGGADADFAVGCGYKYLNGGPGAPAFAFVAHQHQGRLNQPLTGWLGHAAPFAFEPDYRPAAGIDRLLCGTPPVLSLTALNAALEVFDHAEALGGLAALEAKAARLTDLFIERFDARCAGQGLRVLTPREASRRGNQVSLGADDPARGYALMQALISEGVIGDFRAPDILRFGFASLYLRHVDVWDGVETLARLIENRAWEDPRFQQRKAVT